MSLEPESVRIENSTDATRGEPLGARALKRRAELAAALESLSLDELRARQDIELALASVDPLLTGDLDRLSDATASELSRWLEHTKHLAETTPEAIEPTQHPAEDLTTNSN